jgi:hypothetical protein
METDYKLKKAGVELAKLLIDFTTLARNERRCAAIRRCAHFDSPLKRRCAGEAQGGDGGRHTRLAFFYPSLDWVLGFISVCLSLLIN